MNTAEKLGTVVGATIAVCTMLLLIAILSAYPMMWIVNYLFAPSFLVAVFGVAKLNFWRALALCFITGFFARTNTPSKK
jgi:hypothetical protein